MKKMTNDFGNIISDNQNSLSVGNQGPLLLQDYILLEKLAHQNRERIPERTVHAKGSGAYGELRITEEFLNIPKQKFSKKVKLLLFF